MDRVAYVQHDDTHTLQTAHSVQTQACRPSYAYLFSCLLSLQRLLWRTMWMTTATSTTTAQRTQGVLYS